MFFLSLWSWEPARSLTSTPLPLTSSGSPLDIHPPSWSCPDYWPMGEGPHLLLQLAELGREAVDADAGLLQLLVGSTHQVAVPLG